MKPSQEESDNGRRSAIEVILDRIEHLRISEIGEFAAALTVRLPSVSLAVVAATEAHGEDLRARALKEVGHT